MRKKWPLIGIFTVFIIGIGILLYPVISNMLQAATSEATIASYQEQVRNLEEEEIEEILEKARAYNKTLVGRVLSDPFDNEAAKRAASQVSILNIGDSIGYLEIPKIKVYLPVYQGTSKEILQKGVGLLENSSLPVGGAGTHAVLSAHRGLPSAKFYDDLDQMEEGDVFSVHILNQVLTYQVDQIKTVLPEQTGDLAVDANGDYVTLLTCTPYGINTHRLLVRGSRIPGESTGEEEEKQMVDTSESGGETVILILVILFIIFGGICLRKKGHGKSRR